MTSYNSKYHDFTSVKSHAEAMQLIHWGSECEANNLLNAMKAAPPLTIAGVWVKAYKKKMYSEVKTAIKFMRHSFLGGKKACKNEMKTFARPYHHMMLKYYDAGILLQSHIYNRDFDMAETSLKMFITVSNIVMSYDAATAELHFSLREDTHNIMISFIKAIVSKAEFEFVGSN